MTSVVLFVGPTLDEAAVRHVIPWADIRPPVEQGDVVAAVLDGFEVVGIVDGYFERVPSVWHKEILWAMSRGVHVFGAASMGALRAAELVAFGMEGVGEIFEAFRDGHLDADDEVTLVHGPREVGYRAASEAMVNVRATLGAACEAGVVDEGTCAAVIASAKALFYPDRTYDRILAEARRRGVTEEDVARLADVVATSRVDQKRADALELLGVIRERVDRGLAPKTIDFAFQHSDYFELLRREVALRAGRAAAVVEEGDALADEVRLDPALRERVDGLAVRLVVAEGEARERGVTFDDAHALDAAAEAFRRERDLLAGDELGAFLDENGVAEADLPRLLANYAAVRWHAEQSRERVVDRYPDALRLLGAHGAIASRVRAKAARFPEPPSLGEARMPEGELFGWYFGERLARVPPRDLEAYARAVGFASRNALLKAILAEYLHARALAR